MPSFRTLPAKALPFVLLRVAPLEMWKLFQGISLHTPKEFDSMIQSYPPYVGEIAWVARHMSPIHCRSIQGYQ